MRLRQLPCRAALALVVTIDRVERGGGLVERGEAEHAFAVREIGARAGVLHDDRLAARQITERAVAHPGVLELHAGRLGAANLAARVLHGGAVALGPPGAPRGVPPPPAVLCQAREVCRVALVGVERQLERLAGAPRQLGELEE